MITARVDEIYARITIAVIIFLYIQQLITGTEVCVCKEKLVAE